MTMTQVARKVLLSIDEAIAIDAALAEPQSIRIRPAILSFQDHPVASSSFAKNTEQRQVFMEGTVVDNMVEQWTVHNRHRDQFQRH
jgi:hypothetical protein